MPKLPSTPPHYIIWTDGSARGRAIGFAALLWRQGSDVVKTVCAGASSKGTASAHVAEWRAAIEGLGLVRGRKRPVWLVCDSQDVVDFAEGIRAQNVAKLQALLGVVGAANFIELGGLVAELPNLRVLKVKGHAGSRGNQLADELACKGRLEQTSTFDQISADELAAEVAELITTSSTDYARRALPRRATSTAIAAAKLRKRDIERLTRGMTFKVTDAEKVKDQSKARKLRAEAERMPCKTKSQKVARAKALAVASNFTFQMRRQRLADKKRAAAVQVLATVQATDVDTAA